MTEGRGGRQVVRTGAAEDRIARHLRDQVELPLLRLGLLARVFSRVKSPVSLEGKLARTDEPYSVDGKRLQDLFGVRVTLYFADDVALVQTILKQNFEFDSESISETTNDSFGPNRCNLIFRLPANLESESLALKNDQRIDATFEVQLRTVLSEGWHEVEHDLRYKRKDDWKERSDLNRSLNGVMATLETCDWTMMQIFAELSLRSFRERNVSAMIHSKFRLRLTGQPIADTPAYTFLANNEPILKALFRVDRLGLLGKLHHFKGELPLTELNVVLFANRAFSLSEELTLFEPPPLRQMFERSFGADG